MLSTRLLIAKFEASKKLIKVPRNIFLASSPLAISCYFSENSSFSRGMMQVLTLGGLLPSDWARFESGILNQWLGDSIGLCIVGPQNYFTAKGGGSAWIGVMKALFENAIAATATQIYVYSMTSAEIMFGGSAVTDRSIRTDKDIKLVTENALFQLSRIGVGFVTDLVCSPIPMMPQSKVSAFIEPGLDVITRTLKTEYVRQEFELSKCPFGSGACTPFVLSVSIVIIDKLVSHGESKFDEWVKKKMEARRKSLPRSVSWDDPLRVLPNLSTSNAAPKVIQRQNSALNDPLKSVPTGSVEYDDALDTDGNREQVPESGYDPELATPLVVINESDDDEIDPPRVTQCEIITSIILNAVGALSGVMGGLHFINAMEDQPTEGVGFESAAAVLSWNIFAESLSGFWRIYSNILSSAEENVSASDSLLNNADTPKSQGEIYSVSASVLSNPPEEYEPPKLR